MEKKKILVLCPYPEGEAAGQRLKYEQYFNFWREAGYEVVVSSFMNQEMWKVLYKEGFLIKKILGVIKGNLIRTRDLFRLKEFDIVYIHQWTTPFGSVIYDWVLRSLAKKIVFDLEDFIFLDRVDSGLSVNPILKFLRTSRRTINLIKSSNYVVTSSPTLNDYCKDLNFNNQSTFISSSIDTERFMPNNSYNNNNKVTVGWTGTQSALPYLDLLREPLIDLKKERDFQLLIISNFDYEFPEMDLKVVKWNKLSEVNDLQKIDIGLYPLPQNDWVLGKSGLKALQYMAIGKPVVATDIGTSKDIITHMESGYLVSKKEDWVFALRNLIDDIHLREKIGKNARKVVVERYSLNATKKKYLEVLNSL